MNYLEFYELSQEPFSNAPVSRFYYSSAQHAQALMRLTHAVSGMKGLAVLVGDIGAGKTTLARRMLDSLPGGGVRGRAPGHHPLRHHRELAAQAHRAAARRREPRRGEARAPVAALPAARPIYEQGKKAVVLIDEAQMLATREIMEEFRGPAEPRGPRAQAPLLRLLRAARDRGQPEARPAARAARGAQVPARAALAPRRPRRTSGTGCGSPARRACPFTHAALARIHAHSRGTPRLINTLCDNALFEGFVARARELDERLRRPRRPRPRHRGAAARAGPRPPSPAGRAAARSTSPRSTGTSTRSSRRAAPPAADLARRVARETIAAA